MRVSFVSLLFFCLLTNMPVIAQVGSIKGLVIDNDTHQPVADANIQIDSLLQGWVSDTNGQFSIQKIPDGLYQLTVSCIGYKTQRQQIKVTNNDLAINIVLQTSSEELQELVITGTGTPHFVKSAPVQTEVFSEKAITSYAANNLENLLKGLSPSFNFNSNAMGAFIRLNGLGNEYILVMLNGKRLYGDVGSQNDLSRIDPATIERIEIVKGASSSLYGSDAIAGVVNIITKRPGNPINIANTTRSGSYGEWIQSNSIAINKGKYQLTTNFSHAQSAGWKNNPYEIDKKGTPENPLDDVLISTYTMTKNPMNSNSVKQNITYLYSPRVTLYSDVELSFREVTPPVKAKGYRYLYHNQSYGMGAKYMLRYNGYVSFDASYDRFKYLYRYDMKYNANYISDDGTSVFITYYPGDKSLNNDQQKITGNIKASFKPNARHNIITGVETEYEWMEAPYRLKERKVDGYMGAVYGQDEITIIQPFIITAGLRLLYHEAFGQKLTPKIALLYKIKNFNFRGTFASGFKTPTLKELYYRYEREDMGAYRLYLGNPELKPQTSNYYSFAVDHSGRVVSTSVTLYNNNLDNMIEYRAISTSREDAERGVEETKLYDNIANARIQGVDASVNFKITKSFEVGGGYSYTNARNITQHFWLKGTSLHHANFKSEWNKIRPKYKLRISLYGDAQSKQFGDALSENYYDQQEAPAYMLWKINTTHGFTIKKIIKAEMTYGVDNILDYTDDRPYGSNYNTTTPGRTFYVSMTLKFAQ